MNLLVVRPFIAPWEVDVYNELEKYQIRVYFALTSLPTSGYEKILRKIPKRYRSYNLHFSKFSNVLSSNFMFKKLIWFRLIWPDTDIGHGLINVIKEVSPSVVDTLENYTLSSFLVTLWKDKLEIKNLVTSWENIVMPFHRFTLRYFVNTRSDCFRAMSRSAETRLVKENVRKENIFIIPPAINSEKFSPGNSELKERLNLQNKKIILFVGRFIRQKGIIELILSMKIIAKKQKDAVLLMVGDGPLRQAIINLSKKLGLEKSVYLYGPVDYDDMPSVYRSGDVLVLPSITTKTWTEQFGYVLVEAMASGIPVVASSCGAIPEVVRNGENGFLVRPGNPVELSEKIVQLLKDDSLREKLGKKGRLTVESRYSLKNVVPKLKNLYITLSQWR